MFQCPACEEWEREEDLEPDGRCWDCAEQSPPPELECKRCGYRKADELDEYCETCHEEMFGWW